MISNYRPMLSPTARVLLDATFTKQAQAKWRQLKTIADVFRRVGGSADELSKGVNLAALKQRTGSVLRAPGADKISQRVIDGERAAQAKLLAPFRGDDDLLRAEVQRLRVPSTHEKLFSRYGQEVPEESGRLFRGTVSGDPTLGGAYNGAFHYAAPTRSGAERYGRLEAPFLGAGHGGLSNRSHLTALQHYKAAPGQKIWRPWGPEDVMTAPAKNRFRIMKDNSGLIGSEETALLRGHNPFLGTELHAGYSDLSQGGISKFFPAGRAANAAKNYRNQTSAYLQQAPGGKSQLVTGDVSGLRTTPWQTSVDNNPVLARLQKNKPQAFQAVMNRRAQQLLGPG